MARLRRMLAPLITIKHMINIENAQVASGVANPIELVQAVAQADVAQFTDVVEGSLVKTVFLEMWIKSFAAAGEDTKFQLVLEKVPQNANPITFTQMNNLMTYPNKKNILYTSQGVIGDLTTQSIPIVRQWFMIPKGKQRFGLGDELIVSVSATAAVIQRCGLCIYKEWK